MDCSVTVRPARDGDEKLMLEFWASVDGDISLCDHKANMVLDPNYLMVAVDKNDEPVGYGGLTQAASDIFYLGNFIVREDFRGKGIGKLIWQALLGRAGDRNIALDAVTYMEDWYAKNGFKFRSSKVGFFKVCVNEDMKQAVPSEYTCRHITDDIWPMVMKYDRKIYPTFDRERILRAWLGVDGTRAVVALHGNKVVGYGSIHEQTKQTYGVRNVLADNESVVEIILRELFKDLPESTVVRFIKMEDKPLPKYLENSVGGYFTSLRMYNKYPVEGIVDKMWLTSAHIL
ncbi:uncharacterized protein F36G3.2-like [Dreissena polymorpha]|uniref:N-acetyltransferase domain-containing protein n=1 Tax=Dreissena polymorpha TaxID=45954 RepID=A0A9D4R462_DREPO|nr:uncharacterized protein F36G3.2-like [Dreissena polymorpha]KAH3854461.1 hypothetical protein DPMN_097003 [Dreissena polymorpha]